MTSNLCAGEALAFWVMSPGVGKIRAEVLPLPGPYDVLVQTHVSAISRGTESLIFQGRVPPMMMGPAFMPFQEGEFPGPIKCGYAAVGRVLSGPERLTGKRVFCLHPHQTRFVVPASAVVVVPERIPDARAALAASMETALNIAWDTPFVPGQRVSVVGGGVIGLLAGWLAAQTPGTEVELIDIDPGRALLAIRLGMEFRLPAEATAGRDAVVHASGTEAGLMTCLSLAGHEATVVEASWYGDRAVTLALGGAFHADRLRIVSSQVRSVSPLMRPRLQTVDRLSRALDLLDAPVLDVLLSDEIPFDALPSTMAAVCLAHSKTRAPLVRYDVMG